MEGGLLSLKWNNHKATFFQALSSLRKLELYTDATLFCEGIFFPVHRLVLSTCSCYFSEIFKKTPCKSPFVILKDIRPKELETILDYMYLGEIDVQQADLSVLMKAAECLQVKGLAVEDEPLPNTKKRQSESSPRETSSNKNRRYSLTEKHAANTPQSSEAEKYSFQTQKEPLLPVETIKIEKCEFEENVSLPTQYDHENIEAYTKKSPDTFESFKVEEFEESSADNVELEKVQMAICDDPVASHQEYDDDDDNSAQSTSFNGMQSSSGVSEQPLETCFLITDSRLGRSKLYKCRLCTYTSVRRDHMSSHIRTHTGEKPYACTLCIYKATELSNLKKHIKRRHSSQ